MLWRITQLVGGLAAASLSAQAALAGALDGYAWSDRPVLVFAPDADDPRLIRQTALFAGSPAALQDRAMPVLAITEDAVTVNGAPSDLSAAALRRAYGVAEGAFAVLLIGKDTGVKFQSDAVAAPERLYALVDAMPMRRRELAARTAAEAD